MAIRSVKPDEQCAVRNNGPKDIVEKVVKLLPRSRGTGKKIGNRKFSIAGGIVLVFHQRCNTMQSNVFLQNLHRLKYLKKLRVLFAFSKSSKWR